MKIKEITILAALSLFVGCKATPEVKTPKTEVENRSQEQASEVETLTLRATGNVYVLVKDKSSNELLYRKTLQEGEAEVLEVDGPVDVFFTAGEHLIIERRGQIFRPKAEGTAKITSE